MDAVLEEHYIEKLNKVIDLVITPEMDEIIQAQELIGMRISGGIDSAFMTYLMMSRYPNKKLLPVTMFNKLRPAAMDAVLNVESKLRELNPDSTLLESEVAFFDTSNWKKTKEMVEESEKTGKKYNPKDIFQQKYYEDLYKRYPELNVYMSGETLNPPIEEQPNIITDDFAGFPNDRNFKKNPISKRIKKTIVYDTPCLFCAMSLHSVIVRDVPQYSIIFRNVQYSVLFHDIPLYSTMFHNIPLYSTLLNGIPLYLQYSLISHDILGVANVADMATYREYGCLL